MFRICLAVFVLIASSQTFAGPALSDSEAASVVEDSWKTLPLLAIPLGTFSVVSGKADTSRGTISSTGYNALVNWQRAGLVAILEDQQYEDFRSGKGFRTDQWFQLTTQGVQKKIVVTVTERGRQFFTGSPTETLQIPQGKFTVTRIVKNEERRKGVDDYRVIMLTYDAAWSQELRAYSSASGTQLAEKRKAVILLKYDPFQSKWKRITNDLANANEEFKTNNVAQALAQ
jgi:hypothetical protein